MEQKKDAAFLVYHFTPGTTTEYAAFISTALHILKTGTDEEKIKAVKQLSTMALQDDSTIPMMIDQNILQLFPSLLGDSVDFELSILSTVLCIHILLLSHLPDRIKPLSVLQEPLMKLEENSNPQISDAASKLLRTLRHPSEEQEDTDDYLSHWVGSTPGRMIPLVVTPEMGSHRRRTQKENQGDFSENAATPTNEQADRFSSNPKNEWENSFSPSKRECNILSSTLPSSHSPPSPTLSTLSSKSSNIPSSKSPLRRAFSSSPRLGCRQRRAKSHSPIHSQKNTSHQTESSAQKKQELQALQSTSSAVVPFESLFEKNQLSTDSADLQIQSPNQISGKSANAQIATNNEKKTTTTNHLQSPIQKESSDSSPSPTPSPSAGSSNSTSSSTSIASFFSSLSSRSDLTRGRSPKSQRRWHTRKSHRSRRSITSRDTLSNSSSDRASSSSDSSFDSSSSSSSFDSSTLSSSSSSSTSSSSTSFSGSYSLLSSSAKKRRGSNEDGSYAEGPGVASPSAQTLYTTFSGSALSQTESVFIPSHEQFGGGRGVGKLDGSSINDKALLFDESTEGNELLNSSDTLSGHFHMMNEASQTEIYHITHHKHHNKHHNEDQLANNSHSSHAQNEKNDDDDSDEHMSMQTDGDGRFSVSSIFAPSPIQFQQIPLSSSPSQASYSDQPDQDNKSSHTTTASNQASHKLLRHYSSQTPNITRSCGESNDALHLHAATHVDHRRHIRSMSVAQDNQNQSLSPETMRHHRSHRNLHTGREEERRRRRHLHSEDNEADDYNDFEAQRQTGSPPIPITFWMDDGWSIRGDGEEGEFTEEQLRLITKHNDDIGLWKARDLIFPCSKMQKEETQRKSAATSKANNVMTSPASSRRSSSTASDSSVTSPASSRVSTPKIHHQTIPSSASTFAFSTKNIPTPTLSKRRSNSISTSLTHSPVASPSITRKQDKKVSALTSPPIAYKQLGADSPRAQNSTLRTPQKEQNLNADHSTAPSQQDVFSADPTTPYHLSSIAPQQIPQTQFPSAIDSKANTLFVTASDTPSSNSSSASTPLTLHSSTASASSSASSSSKTMSVYENDAHSLVCTPRIERTSYPITHSPFMKDVTLSSAEAHTLSIPTSFGAESKLGNSNCRLSKSAHKSLGSEKPDGDRSSDEDRSESPSDLFTFTDSEGERERDQTKKHMQHLQHSQTVLGESDQAFYRAVNSVDKVVERSKETQTEEEWGESSLSLSSLSQTSTHHQQKELVSRGTATERMRRHRRRHHGGVHSRTLDQLPAMDSAIDGNNSTDVASVDGSKASSGVQNTRGNSGISHSDGHGRSRNDSSLDKKPPRCSPSQSETRQPAIRILPPTLATPATVPLHSTFSLAANEKTLTSTPQHSPPTFSPSRAPLPVSPISLSSIPQNTSSTSLSTSTSFPPSHSYSTNSTLYSPSSIQSTDIDSDHFSTPTHSPSVARSGSLRRKHLLERMERMSVESDPELIRKRAEERLVKATRNREMLLEEQISKGRMVTDKIREAMEKKAETLEQMRCESELRIKEAEQRHEQHLQQIIVKARGVESKASEVNQAIKALAEHDKEVMEQKMKEKQEQAELRRKEMVENRLKRLQEQHSKIRKPHEDGETFEGISDADSKDNTSVDTNDQSSIKHFPYSINKSAQNEKDISKPSQSSRLYSSAFPFSLRTSEAQSKQTGKEQSIGKDYLSPRSGSAKSAPSVQSTETENCAQIQPETLLIAQQLNESQKSQSNQKKSGKQGSINQTTKETASAIVTAANSSQSKSSFPYLNETEAQQKERSDIWLYSFNKHNNHKRELMGNLVFASRKLLHENGITIDCNTNKESQNEESNTRGTSASGEGKEPQRKQKKKRSKAQKQEDSVTSEAENQSTNQSQTQQAENITKQQQQNSQSDTKTPQKTNSEKAQSQQTQQKQITKAQHLNNLNTGCAYLLRRTHENPNSRFRILLHCILSILRKEREMTVGSTVLCDYIANEKDAQIFTQDASEAPEVAPAASKESIADEKKPSSSIEEASSSTSQSPDSAFLRAVETNWMLGEEPHLEKIEAKLWTETLTALQQLLVTEPASCVETLISDLCGIKLQSEMDASVDKGNSVSTTLDSAKTSSDCLPQSISETDWQAIHGLNKGKIHVATQKGSVTTKNGSKLLFDSSVGCLIELTSFFSDPYILCSRAWLSRMHNLISLLLFSTPNTSKATSSDGEQQQSSKMLQQKPQKKKGGASIKQNEEIEQKEVKDTSAKDETSHKSIQNWAQALFRTLTATILALFIPFDTHPLSRLADPVYPKLQSICQSLSRSQSSDSETKDSTQQSATGQDQSCSLESVQSGTFAYASCAGLQLRDIEWLSETLISFTQLFHSLSLIPFRMKESANHSKTTLTDCNQAFALRQSSDDSTLFHFSATNEDQKAKFSISEFLSPLLLPISSIVSVLSPYMVALLTHSDGFHFLCEAFSAVFYPEKEKLSSKKGFSLQAVATLSSLTSPFALGSLESNNLFEFSLQYTHLHAKEKEKDREKAKGVMPVIPFCVINTVTSIICLHLPHFVHSLLTVLELADLENICNLERDAATQRDKYSSSFLGKISTAPQSSFSSSQIFPVDEPSFITLSIVQHVFQLLHPSLFGAIGFSIKHILCIISNIISPSIVPPYTPASSSTPPIIFSSYCSSLVTCISTNNLHFTFLLSVLSLLSRLVIFLNTHPVLLLPQHRIHTTSTPLSFTSTPLPIDPSLSPSVIASILANIVFFIHPALPLLVNKYAPASSIPSSGRLALSAQQSYQNTSLTSSLGFAASSASSSSTSSHFIDPSISPLMSAFAVGDLSPFLHAVSSPFEKLTSSASSTRTSSDSIRPSIVSLAQMIINFEYNASISLFSSDSKNASSALLKTQQPQVASISQPSNLQTLPQLIQSLLISACILIPSFALSSPSIQSCFFSAGPSTSFSLFQCVSALSTRPHLLQTTLPITSSTQPSDALITTASNPSFTKGNPFSFIDSSTLLFHLCRFPVPFFVKPHLSSLLFPLLIATTFRRPEATAFLSNEANLLVLSNFVSNQWTVVSSPLRNAKKSTTDTDNVPFHDNLHLERIRSIPTFSDQFHSLSTHFKSHQEHSLSFLSYDRSLFVASNNLLALVVDKSTKDEMETFFKET
ncbi:uncharacterized protein MONOS_1643 [Monocercomonoides exilis]|uniref:uncharacterized protein n=1 Tax=Monocercomonoides exilis TaxID=2049356 RepID=UPI00355ABD52|nr:hypothetical protein MONOS_1643 [Monocercomonoides exilis]|eukprot:MONOS_1643.1-p1 / transcript=MONOS_1643.1 / gene=MONOS_1643 / organism=Monocercomonoides_exilis_PA203 / gene_product=unspecified product / transcript_product=unspecified product / location=Mono_scaffold00030:78011-87820(+) / protein_length=3137 / sequence_SO=supercontig / SO=protein_coding / is_pseudo=false